MRLTKWAARLYPRWWRERYGDEFAVLIEDARPGFGGTVDVARGAMAMQIVTWPAKRIVALGTLFGLIGGLAIALREPTYEAAVVLASASPLDTNAVYATAVADAFTRSKLTSIVRKSDLYRVERTRMTLGDLMEKMRRDLVVVPRAQVTDGLHELEIRFRYSDGATARKTVATLGQLFIDQAHSNGFEIQQMEEEVPAKRIFPNAGAFVGAGFLSGFLITGLFALGLFVGRRQVSAKQE